MTVWGSAPRQGPLAGVRVLDFGQYIAGPLATMLLTDQGADVIRVDPPGGPRWDSPANAALLRGRRNIVLNLREHRDRERARALAASADVIIENFRPGVMSRLGLDPEHVRAVNPRVIFCSLPGFGHDDLRATVPAWEGVVMAAGGGYSTTGLRISGWPTEDPAFSPLPLASIFAGLEAAMAVGAALVARERDGYGQWIEVPLFDALFEASGVQGMTLERSPLAGSDFGSGMYVCGDGRRLTFVAQWFRHLEWLLHATGCASWIAEGIASLDHLRTEGSDELRRRLTTLFATRPAQEWEDLARGVGCSIAVVRSTAEFAAHRVAEESGALALVDDPVLGSVRVPSRAVDSSHDAAPISARALPGSDTLTVLTALDELKPLPRQTPRRLSPRAAPLKGIRVLEMSRVVAAPTSTKLLAQLGAEVVKLDVDPAGSTAAFEEPLFHLHLNRGKSSVIADLTTDAGQRTLTALIAQCDVVVHNFTLGTAERIGIDDTSVRTTTPDAVTVYINAFGTTGAWSAYRGYAELANVASGLTEFCLGEQLPASASSPSVDIPRWIFTDYATGVLGAFAALLGLYDKARTGVGTAWETSLLRATSLEQILWIVSDTDMPTARSRGRGATGWAPLQRLYSTSDGSVFIGARPHAFPAVCAALNLAPTLDGDSFEEAIAQRLATTSTAEVCTALAACDVGAHAVTSLTDLLRAGGVADDRGLRVRDESPRHGEVVMPGPVVRFSETPMHARALPLPFGADRISLPNEESG